MQQCIDTSAWGTVSIGPDAGIKCTTFSARGCNENTLVQAGLEKPGDGNVRGVKSFHCSTKLDVGAGY